MGAVNAADPLFDYPWEDRRRLTYWSDVAICNVRAPESPVHSEQEKFDELKKMAERMAELYNERADTYLFCIGEGDYVIDGDSVAAFINHCCEPNCETDEFDEHIWIIAQRDIAAGEELTYDYNLYDGDDDDEAPCRCGAKQCRGSMYGEEELERRAKAKAGELKK